MEPIRPQLGRLVTLPFATIGVLSALVVWEVEHVSSPTPSLAIAAIAAVFGAIVARRVRAHIDELAAHYEGLLQIADDQSRRAEAASRVKDEFLATLSHELRTPLNSVLGWSRLLSGDKLDPGQKAKAARAIERAVLAQSELIENLLDISQMVNGKLQITTKPTFVQPIVEHAVKSLHSAAAAKKLGIDLHMNPAVGPILGDANRLHQVAWNLALNAIKFTPPGGHVSIHLDQADGQLRLSVEDTGIGFTTETAVHLFERFQQADSSTTREYGGVGLGLGIVRHLIELHGGTVSAYSAGEQLGATFEVRLPLQPLGAEISPPPEASPINGVSVLVVDDDPEALEYVRCSLELYGARVSVARSAREARDRIANAPPDVLLSDLKMPNEDGLELIRQVRRLDAPRARHTPAAALTAMARADDRIAALSAGYQMHVQKPVDPAELAEAVEKLVHHRPGGAPIAPPSDPAA